MMQDFLSGHKYFAFANSPEPSVGFVMDALT